MPRDVIFIGPPGEREDSWLPILNEARSPHVRLWVSRGGVGTLREVVEDNGLERIELVSYGPGVITALLYAVDQPERIGRAVFVEPVLGADSRTLARLIAIVGDIPDALATPTVSGVDKISVLGSTVTARIVAEKLGVTARPGVGDYRAHPREFVAGVSDVLCTLAATDRVAVGE